MGLLPTELKIRWILEHSGIEPTNFSSIDVWVLFLFRLNYNNSFCRCTRLTNRFASTQIEILR